MKCKEMIDIAFQILFKFIIYLEYRTNIVSWTQARASFCYIFLPRMQTSTASHPSSYYPIPFVGFSWKDITSYYTWKVTD